MTSGSGGNGTRRANVRKPEMAGEGEVIVVDDRPKPTFDLSGTGYRWSRDYMRAIAAIGKCHAVIDAHPRDDLSEYQMAMLEQQKALAWEELPEAIDRRDGLIALVLVDVPREMLTPDAPEDIDWSDPESLGWVRSIDSIMMALNAARRPDERGN